MGYYVDCGNGYRYFENIYRARAYALEIVGRGNGIRCEILDGLMMRRIEVLEW